jgi:transcriptional regulator of acetoin/glycerol metabolism
LEPLPPTGGSSTRRARTWSASSAGGRGAPRCRPALQRTRGNVSEAARVLGIDRVTLYHKLKKYGIPRREPAQ